MRISVFLLSFCFTTASLFAQVKKDDLPTLKLTDGYFYAVGSRPIRLTAENARYPLGHADHFYLFLDLIPIDEKKNCADHACELTIELAHWNAEGKEVSSQLKRAAVVIGSSRTNLAISDGIRSDVAVKESALVIRITKGGAEYFRLNIPVLID